MRLGNADHLVQGPISVNIAFCVLHLSVFCPHVFVYLMNLSVRWATLLRAIPGFAMNLLRVLTTKARCGHVQLAK